jgi:hypothetical protein
LNFPERIDDWAAWHHPTHTKDGAEAVQQRSVKPVGNLKGILVGLVPYDSFTKPRVLQDPEHTTAFDL